MSTPREPKDVAATAGYHAAHPDVVAFLRFWHESGRKSFERSCSNLVYDSYAAKRAKDRRKYVALDTASGSGWSGKYLLDKATGEVWGIKAYGVPNHGHFMGTLAEFTALLAKERVTP